MTHLKSKQNTDGIHVIKGACDVGCMCREEGEFCRWCYG